MSDRGRLKILIPAIVLILALGTLTRSSALSGIRSVDALMVFVAGGAGVLLTGLLAARR
jgi:hypothetical protein